MGAKLNTKQWLIASLAVFVVLTLTGLIQNRVLLSGWQPEGGPYKDPETSRYLIWLSRLLLSGIFTYIFTRGYEGKSGMGEGFRYGVLMGLLLFLPRYFADMVTTDWQSLPLLIVAISGIAEITLAGIAAGLVYKPLGSRAPQPA